MGQETALTEARRLYIFHTSKGACSRPRICGIISRRRSLSMTLESFFSAIAALSGLTFVVAGMLAMGLSLTVNQIVQPLKNVRLVILALLANFILVPLLAVIITRVIPLDESLRTGLIVLSTVAGAPFLVKEVQAAKGNLALGVGLMFLLMVVTIVYVPIALPLLLPGVAVNPWDIAKSLIVTMLIPIILGLLIRAHSAEDGQHWAPVMNKVSGIALLLLLVTGVGLNVSNIISLIGSGGFLALILFVVGSLAIGLVSGGRDTGVRSVMGLGTAQRNVAAAILVTTLNFPGTMTLPYVLVASIVLPLILIPVARALGRRGETPTSTPSVQAK
jgi:BASS family bile acid:Na+ symporter